MNGRSGTQSRLNILRAALNVFAESGYKQASMRQIARDADTGVGTLYLYFKNKESLYLELIAEEARDFEEHIEPLRSLDPVAALKSYIQANIDYSRTRRKLVSHYLKDHDLRCTEDVRRGFFKSQRHLLEGILATGQKAGLFPAHDPKKTALIILFAIRGAIITHLATGDVELDGFADMLCRTVLGTENPNAAAARSKNL